MAQSPCFFTPLAEPLYPFSMSPLLSWKPSFLWQDPSTLVSGYSYTGLPFPNPSPFPPHSLPTPNSQYPGQISASLRRLQESGFSCPEHLLFQLWFSTKHSFVNHNQLSSLLIGTNETNIDDSTLKQNSWPSLLSTWSPTPLHGREAIFIHNYNKGLSDEKYLESTLLYYCTFRNSGGSAVPR